MTERLNKDEVLTRLCALSSMVMHKKFDCVEAADCFCGDALAGLSDFRAFDDFRFSSLVLGFIETAVKKELESRDD